MFVCVCVRMSKQRLATKLLHDLHAKDRQISRARLCVVFFEQQQKVEMQQKPMPVVAAILVFHYNRKKKLNPEDNLMLFWFIFVVKTNRKN